jgi:hypothetical protein
MELVLIGLAALLTSGLTLFSGFGLGTILMPVFALFFPAVHGFPTVDKRADDDAVGCGYRGTKACPWC